ncbi:hypothetical protein RFI_19446 [Reticulomyxa filosa]|uniref:Uncharacterized protein n=1 Tax=Reticulomyxa filosa TaxID=46433 RepID=X6MVM3_RETFI|nr:hypothetical protein RFI_19446 [Reticulomyxa filosa]|eukprot:ETO17864.1 hypothetical protein RFI_19446 [Reticulomyxa filosa]
MMSCSKMMHATSELSYIILKKEIQLFKTIKRARTKKKLKKKKLNGGNNAHAKKLALSTVGASTVKKKLDKHKMLMSSDKNLKSSSKMYYLNNGNMIPTTTRLAKTTDFLYVLTTRDKQTQIYENLDSTMCKFGINPLLQCRNEVNYFTSNFFFSKRTGCCTQYERLQRLKKYESEASTFHNDDSIRYYFKLWKNHHKINIQKKDLWCQNTKEIHRYRMANYLTHWFAEYQCAKTFRQKYFVTRIFVDWNYITKMNKNFKEQAFAGSGLHTKK